MATKKVAKKVVKNKELEDTLQEMGSKLADVIKNGRKVVKTWKMKKEQIAKADMLAEVFEELAKAAEAADKLKKKFWADIEKDLKVDKKKMAGCHLHLNEDDKTISLIKEEYPDGIQGILAGCVHMDK